jgi:hypothetical protein
MEGSRSEALLRVPWWTMEWDGTWDFDDVWRDEIQQCSVD